VDSTGNSATVAALTSQCRKRFARGEVDSTSLDMNSVPASSPLVEQATPIR